ncbi:radical SAM protein [Rhodoplanes sp. Z2-YC6860]|uniref:radical SAM protein n=1 Tax=Rhodoplanes sp. Z2-YC6860 TaxID=674703 RepID=UPI0012ED2EF1|nr:radical SAM protein [Rhodoplanes sp. Z2-YC6860]
MKYDIEADWVLLDTCNYRCGYCPIPHEKLGSKIHTFATVDAWRAAFDASGKTWLAHITGGEPSAYPDFVELCEALTDKHYISLNSNMSNRSLIRFANSIDPSRVSFINAGLHLEERQHRSGVDAFLRHAQELRVTGFRILVSVVATPSILERFEEAIRLLEPIGLFPIPKLMRGPFAGALYPNAYTDADKSRFRTYSRLAREFYREILSRIDEPPSLGMLHDDAYVDAVPDFTGRMCEAGRKFIQLEPNGDVFRCGGKDRQGNLLDGSFVRRLRAEPCNSTHCYYFCNKYVAPEATGAWTLPRQWWSRLRGGSSRVDG